MGRHWRFQIRTRNVCRQVNACISLCVLLDLVLFHFYYTDNYINDIEPYLDRFVLWRERKYEEADISLVRLHTSATDGYSVP